MLQLGACRRLDERRKGNTSNIDDAVLEWGSQSVWGTAQEERRSYLTHLALATSSLGVAGLVDWNLDCRWRGREAVSVVPVPLEK